MSSSRTELSLLEILDLILTILKAASVAIISCLGVPFRGPRGHRRPLLHVIHTVMRFIDARLTANQIQRFSPPTDEAYETFARSKQFNPTSIELPHEARAHWIGPPSAERILVFLHGGGFVFPAVVHFEYIYGIQKLCGDDTAGIILSYSLAPGRQYPHQLKQAVSLIAYLIEVAQKKPENIILAGDSAGGNLVLGVLSHILHPHPDKSIAPFQLRSPLGGALAVSPWSSMETSAPSFLANGGMDCVDGPVLDRWGRYYMGDAPPDEYNQPAMASEKWWHGLDTVARDIFVTAGVEEVLFSDIKTLVEKLKAACPKAEYLFASGETHDRTFSDLLLGGKTESETASAVKSWILVRLQQ